MKKFSTNSSDSIPLSITILNMLSITMHIKQPSEITFSLLFNITTTTHASLAAINLFNISSTHRLH